MSVRNRLEDARVLKSLGRTEGAFIQVLIAAAATSRKRYDFGTWDDGEAFKNFAYDEMGVITGGPMYNVAFPFQGKTTPLEDILYHHLRCQLVHEGEMPNTIVFLAPAPDRGFALRLADPLGVSESIVETLATAVWLAPENDDLWQDDAARRRTARELLAERRHSISFSRRPGQQTKEMKGKRERSEWTHDGLTVAISYPPGTDATKLAHALEAKAASLRSAT